MAAPQLPQHIIDPYHITVPKHEQFVKLFGEKSCTIVKAAQTSNPILLTDPPTFTQQCITNKEIICKINVDAMIYCEANHETMPSPQFYFRASGIHWINGQFHIFSEAQSASTFPGIVSIYNSNVIPGGSGETWFCEGDDMLVFGDEAFKIGDYLCGYYQVPVPEKSSRYFHYTQVLAYDKANAEGENITQTPTTLDVRYKLLLMYVELYQVPREINNEMRTYDISFGVELSVNGKRGNRIYNPARQITGPTPGSSISSISTAIDHYNLYNLHEWVEV